MKTPKYQQVDQFTQRKGKIVKKSLSHWKGRPLFSVIEISPVAACNRRCTFCPVSEDYYKKHGLRGVMKKSLYEKLIGDLASIEYAGMILFSGECEPLLHKRLADWIGTTKQRLPNVTIEVNTNGDLLNLDELNSLFASGLDTISISMYDGPHQVDHFESLRKNAMLSKKQILLRRRYEVDGDYGMVMSNRGGLINNDDYTSTSEEEVDFPIKKNCYYPFYYLVADGSGNVTMCSHDWGKKYVCGNFSETHIFDIWVNDRLKEARKKLSNCDRSLPSCDRCNAMGDLIGAESFYAWQSISNASKI